MGEEIFCRKCFLVRLAALLLWSSLILFLSLAPQPPQPTQPQFAWDKLQHAGFYSLLALLGARFFRQWRPTSRFPWSIAVAAAVLYGGLIEILQGLLTISRVADWRDVLANGAGAIFAAGLALVIGRRKGAASGTDRP